MDDHREHSLKERLERAVSLLRQRLPGLLGVWLYGSAVTGSLRDDSDLDLAVLAEHPLAPAGLLPLTAELAAILGRDVDLLDLATASTVMRMQVVGRGRRLACTHPLRCESFEDFVFSDYARLNEERAAILAEVAARGRIHG